MASRAHAMLRSRDFGSSGSSEDGEDVDEEGAHLRHAARPGHGRDQAINNTYDSYADDEPAEDAEQHDYTQSYVGQDTAANLASFEESFVPHEALQAGAAGHHHETRPAPKTPAAKDIQRETRIVTDAAGNLKQNGPKDLFARHSAGIVNADYNANESTAGGETEGQNDYGASGRDDTSGLVEQPSFERSESQSMRIETAANRKGKTAGGATARDSDRQVKQGSKQQLTLREQEKLIDEVKKDNFSLKLKIYFLEERLAKLAPEHVDAALKETIELKVEYQNVKQELKKHKKWLLEATNALDASRRNQDLAHGQLSKTESDANAEIQQLREQLQLERQAREEEREDLHAQLDAAEARANGHADDADQLHKTVETVEAENAHLRAQVNAQVTMLATRNDEKERLYDELETLKQENVALDNELQDAREQAGSGSDREAAVAELEDELNEYRDKLSAATLDLERREKEIEELNAELDQRDAEREQEITNAVEEWKAALEDARWEKDQAVSALEDREKQVEELQKKLKDLSAIAKDEQEQAQRALRKASDKQREVDALGEEVMDLTDDIQKLGKEIESLQDEVDDKTARIADLERELDGLDQDLADRQKLHDQVVAALKEKASSSKSRHMDLTIQQESLTTEVTFLRGKTEELALKCAELEESKRTSEGQRQKLEDEKARSERKLREREAELQQAELTSKRELGELENHWRNIVSEKEQSVSSVRSQLRQVQDRLQVREQDMERLNEVLQNRDAQTKKLGDSHTSDRMALVLEVERLHRDLAHYEADLDHARSELEKKEESVRQREMEAATLRATNNDIAAQLALQTQTRLNLSEKLDVASESLRRTQEDLAQVKDKFRRAEKNHFQNSRSGRVSADQREQLAERNALLQNAYAAIDKVVGGDRRKAGQADLQPHTNFAVFHDAIMSRIRTITQVQQSFDKKARDIEARFVEQISTLKKQQDSRLRQLDRLESAVKTAVDTQKQWKQRVLLKHNEIESVKATNGELNEQLSSLKTRVSVSDMSPGSTHKIQTLTARASTAERRWKATQDQLDAVESKYAEAKTKIATAEDNWQARLRELMTKLKEAEEKNKRERQGAKERVRELQQTIGDLQQQIDNAGARSRKLAHVLDNQVV